jgi:thiol-disulfide isomerase/thioredoxin
MKVLIVIAFIFCGPAFGQKKPVEPIQKVPSLALYNLKGDTTNLLVLSKDKITFIDFWFIPCGPCFAEMNMLHMLYARYRDSANISFITITLTDSAFVRPLTENRNSDSNQTYTYFKRLAVLDTFRLPVYFIKNVVSKQRSFVQSKIGFTGRGEPALKDKSAFPDKIFGFPAYPTILIFDKKGQLIYNKTGFTKGGELQQLLRIQTVIDKHI